MTPLLTLHVGTIVDDNRNRLIVTCVIRPFATYAIRLGVLAFRLFVVPATRLYVASAAHRVVLASRPVGIASHRPAEAAIHHAQVLTATAIGPGAAVCPYVARPIRLRGHTIILLRVATLVTRW